MPRKRKYPLRIPPPSPTDAEIKYGSCPTMQAGPLKSPTVVADAGERYRQQGQTFEEEQRRRRAAESAAHRVEALPPLITDEQLNEVLAADNPAVRDRIAARHATEKAPADLAEAQVALTGRCTRCGKPVTGRDVPRDRSGRPRHHRCPP